MKKKQMLSDILWLIRHQSFTGDAIGIREAQSFVQYLANRFGFTVESAANGKVIVITPPNMVNPESPKLSILCHLDTVPFDSKEWKYNPLGEISNGRIYGRGVIDDKAAIIIALHEAFSDAASIEPSWQIIVGSSEEGKWVDMEDYAKENHPIPQFATTLDGDGIQFGCRGYLDVVLTFKNLSQEENIVSITVPGNASNVVPSTAMATLKNGTILKARGVSVHSSQPGNGLNAISELAKCIELLTMVEFPGFANFMEKYGTSYFAYEFGFEHHDETIFGSPNPQSTICPTNCWIDDNGLNLALNIRLAVGTTEDEVNQALNHICSIYGCTSEVKELTLPAFMSSESPMIQAQLKAYEDVMGVSTTPTLAPGTGYNAAFRSKNGCNIFGPRFDPEHDENDLCHCTDESRRINDILKFYTMYSNFMKNFLGK